MASKKKSSKKMPADMKKAPPFGKGKSKKSGKGC